MRTTGMITSEWVGRRQGGRHHPDDDHHVEGREDDEGPPKAPTLQKTQGPHQKIDRAAFKAEREAFWKAEAKRNP
ncbi:MAG: hypothetical protein IPM54_03375 [Polyangiaceae bacterium]|nr:hypothetical protein [Polyangiaceae bacterium]